MIFSFIKKHLTMDSFRFIKAQTNAMDKSKYIESQKIGKDLFFDDHGKPSQAFYFWWIKNHAENFRKAWYISCCRQCLKVINCKDCLKDSCIDFVFDPQWANTCKMVVKIRNFIKQEVKRNDLPGR